MRYSTRLMIGGREIAAGDLAALRPAPEGTLSPAEMARVAGQRPRPRLGFLGREFGAHLGAAGRAA